MQVYEGNQNNCLIDNLNSNTNYEIRICSINNDLISPWTQIYKVKTLFDSIILEGTKKEDEFLKKRKEWINYKRLELIYRGTRDGSTANIFHKNVIIRVLPFVYIKMIKGIFLEALPLFLGKKKMELILMTSSLNVHHYYLSQISQNGRQII